MARVAHDSVGDVQKQAAQLRVELWWCVPQVNTRENLQHINVYNIEMVLQGSVRQS